MEVALYVGQQASGEQRISTTQKKVIMQSNGGQVQYFLPEMCQPLSTFFLRQFTAKCGQASAGWSGQLFPIHFAIGCLRQMIKQYKESRHHICRDTCLKVAT